MLSDSARVFLILCLPSIILFGAFIANVFLSSHLQKPKDGINGFLLFLETTLLPFGLCGVLLTMFGAYDTIVKWTIGLFKLPIPSLLLIIDALAISKRFRKHKIVTILCSLWGILTLLPLLVFMYPPGGTLGGGDYPWLFTAIPTFMALCLYGIFVILKFPLMLCHFFYLLYGTYRQSVSRRKKGEV
ncbi:MAG: hypothetical protein LBI29_00375 [Rickettsiales bacterium]|jgi:hypothetical protein|nr:hypothetical protein [Rickettsiales bacterium]